MNLFEYVVWSRGEKHLASYRDNAKNVSSTLRATYKSYLPHIQRTYPQATYWHGTGRYHYYNSNDSRYASNGGIVDVLESILATRELSGHHDLWFQPGGKNIETVSVAPSRMHARLYAHIHLCDGEWLEYVFGGTRFWMSLFVLLASKEILLGRKQKGWWGFIRAIVRPSFVAHARTYAHAIRHRTNTLPPLWRGYDLRSDIEGNHPILFGLKKEAIRNNDVLPFLRKFEVRIPEPILIKHVTHIEVPRVRVQEITSLLEKRGMQIPVIPLETGELYCSTVPMLQLIYA